MTPAERSAIAVALRMLCAHQPSTLTATVARDLLARRFGDEADTAGAQGKLAAVVPQAMMEALQFYGAGQHFLQHKPSAWDDVENAAGWMEDDANTAMVELGMRARLALDGHRAADAGKVEAIKLLTDKQIVAAITKWFDTDGSFRGRMRAVEACMAKAWGLTLEGCE